MLFHNASSRNRRLKLSASRRKLVRETAFSHEALVFPMTVDPGLTESVEIAHMPGCFRYSLEDAVKKARRLVERGIPALYLIVVPDRFDETGSVAWDEAGCVVEVLKRIKDAVGDDLTIIGDSYLGYFTSHRIGGVLDSQKRIDDRATLESVVKTAVAWARAGTDILCCSTMVDGRIAAIRQELDARNLTDMILMSAIKYDSMFFKVGTAPPAAGALTDFDKATFYLDPCNSRDALRIAATDLREGAEILSIMPAVPYLDVLKQLSDHFDVPTMAFSVSGDYSMAHFAGMHAGMDAYGCALETIQSLRRAGASCVITHWADRMGAVHVPGQQ